MNNLTSNLSSFVDFVVLDAGEVGRRLPDPIEFSLKVGDHYRLRGEHGGVPVAVDAVRLVVQRAEQRQRVARARRRVHQDELVLQPLRGPDHLYLYSMFSERGQVAELVTVVYSDPDLRLVPLLHGDQALGHRLALEARHAHVHAARRVRDHVVDAEQIVQA